MQVISIAARKGGSGKTTLATHLSVLAADKSKPVLLLDTDPQRSLAWWWRQRDAETPQLVECDGRDLPKVIEVAGKEGVHACIVDTPPHAENSILSAMRVSDIIIIPTRPGPFDLAACSSTIEMAARVGKKALTVINHAPPRTGSVEPSIVAEAREALKAMGATVAETVVSQRVAFSHAVISGATVTEYEPEGRAAVEMKALWAEIQKTIGGK